ncbi:transmembrane protein, putative [Bodo saltans]|uniref:Transmembrane protein, putative n=1 Tax=Bodo saltans TaxID=75058 RepID=A0A0S4JGR9_BODSA|nr:transmembrane protein, putative [Bodo saltans]|eukprot:CUG89338.1 transmembrane protein, putative [Bodo saltans]
MTLFRTVQQTSAAGKNFTASHRALRSAALKANKSLSSIRGGAISEGEHKDLSKSSEGSRPQSLSCGGRKLEETTASLEPRVTATATFPTPHTKDDEHKLTSAPRRRTRRGDPFRYDPFRRNAPNMLRDDLPDRTQDHLSNVAAATSKGSTRIATTEVLWDTIRIWRSVLRRFPLRVGVSASIITAPVVFWNVYAYCLTPNHIHEEVGDDVVIRVLLWNSLRTITMMALKTFWGIVPPPCLSDADVSSAGMELGRDRRGAYLKSPKLLTVDERVVVAAQVGCAASLLTIVFATFLSCVV